MHSIVAGNQSLGHVSVSPSPLHPCCDTTLSLILDSLGSFKSARGRGIAGRWERLDLLSFFLWFQTPPIFVAFVPHFAGQDGAAT
jgi:hypothetical protein